MKRGRPVLVLIATLFAGASWLACVGDDPNVAAVDAIPSGANEGGAGPGADAGSQPPDNSSNNPAVDAGSDAAPACDAAPRSSALTACPGSSAGECNRADDSHCLTSADDSAGSCAPHSVNGPIVWDCTTSAGCANTGGYCCLPTSEAFGATGICPPETVGRQTGASCQSTTCGIHQLCRTDIECPSANPTCVPFTASIASAAVVLGHCK